MVKPTTKGNMDIEMPGYIVKYIPIAKDNMPLTKCHPQPCNVFEFCMEKKMSNIPDVRKDMLKRMESVTYVSNGIVKI